MEILIYSLMCVVLGYYYTEAERHIFFRLLYKLFAGLVIVWQLEHHWVGWDFAFTEYMCELLLVSVWGLRIGFVFAGNEATTWVMQKTNRRE
jgi:hypothetical protein